MEAGRQAHSQDYFKVGFWTFLLAPPNKFGGGTREFPWDSVAGSWPMGLLPDFETVLGTRRGAPKWAEQAQLSRELEIGGLPSDFGTMSGVRSA